MSLLPYSYHTNTYLYPPQLHPASILARHFGPFGTGPLSPAAVQFMNAVAPGFTPYRQPPPFSSAPTPRTPRTPRVHRSQYHRGGYSSRPGQHSRWHGHRYGYRPVYYAPPYGYGYGYNSGYHYR
ncbi:hypothetical protein F4779DRAFT_591327 [Xylariaceae sp. FL0662B]|nr:hypothetical protein F4779DRAFT_591327 [Xylariaceae sp. FL0662B]